MLRRIRLRVLVEFTKERFGLAPFLGSPHRRQGSHERPPVRSVRETRVEDGDDSIEDGGAAQHILYGDLHVHSNDTVGTNDTAYNLAYGRDVAGLDVLGYTANDFNVTKERWDASVELIATFNTPGRFICYPGTE